MLQPKSAFATCLISAFISATLAALSAAQESWTRFHGPNGTGVVADAKLPVEFSDANKKWEQTLQGSGSGSPVLWHDQVFITSCDQQSGELYLQNFDAKTGKPGWTKSFHLKPHRVHQRNSFASSTPAVDAEHVYLSFASPESTKLIALDHAGNSKWERDFGSFVSQHGYSASPIVYKDKVLLFDSQQAQRVKPGTTPGESRLIAVNKLDGTDAWTAPLTTTRTCYAVPSVYTNAAGEDQIISYNTGDGFFSIDPETGKRNWAALPFKMRTCASTLIVDGMVIGSNGSGGGGNYLVAAKLNADNKETAPTKAYTLKKANYVPSPVAANGLLFFFSDKGIGNCVDLKTGESKWQERLAVGFSGSAVANQENVYIIDEEGTLHVIAATAEFKHVAKFDLGESSRSTPAIAHDRIYLRTETTLKCFE